MFKHGDFFDSINRFTLFFKDPDLEALYCDSRRKHLKFFNASKIMIIIVSITLSGFFSYTVYMYHQMGNVDAEKRVIAITVVAGSAWIFEYITHCFRCLHTFVGFPMVIMFCWVVVETPSVTLPSFAFAPGGISLFLLMLFCGIFYSKNWMLATLAQTIGYAMITALAWNNFSNKMDKIRLITIEINMNIGLLVNTFICRYVETQLRMTVFAKWQTDRVLVKALSL